MSTLLRHSAILLLGVAALWALGGCATRERLALADRAEQIVLQDKVSYVTHGLSGLRWEYMALPGTYEAERKDQGGVYFYGRGRSIVMISELYKNEPRLMIGGVYLPSDPSEPVQMVFASEMDVHTVSDVNQYIADRTVTTTAMPALRPGIGAGPNIVGHVVAGALIGALMAASVGEINRVTVTDPAVGERLRSARRPTPTGSSGGERPRASE